MVVIGHSMGGCISRLLITDAGDALIFQHCPEIGRVIFISAPLRGSELASNWLLAGSDRAW
jgi:triacylglycerol esterase/lipase EstA (alpha/beta hydrolase family)